MVLGCRLGLEVNETPLPVVDFTHVRMGQLHLVMIAILGWLIGLHGISVSGSDLKTAQ